MPVARSAAARLAAFLLIAVFPAEALSQVVTGQLLDASAGRPVASAFVQLLNAEGVRQSGALTDSAGRFTLRAPSAGEYRLVADRLGYEAVTSPVLSLGTAVVHYVFELNPRALVLPSVDAHAEDSRGCQRRPDGQAVVALWDAVRSALRVTSWTGRTGGVRFSMMNYHRELDRSLRSVRREVRTPSYATAAIPYGAIRPERLASEGYAVSEGETTWLLGLDADVLLSESFLDSHCFRIVSSPRPDRIGLGFTPLRDDGRADVSGVLWVDRTTAELRYLEFEYENLPDHMRRYDASGEVHFERLSTGAWIITRWWIRSPLVGLSRRSRSYRLLGYREDGGTVTSAETIDVNLYGRTGSATIEGVVHDSVTNRPLAHALVFLSGTPFSAVADSSGRYRMQRVPGGQYSMGFTHPLLEELGVPRPLEPVSIAGDSVLRRNFAAPSMAGILGALCPGERAEPTQGLLYGFVKDAGTGEPLAGVEVRASWRGPPLVTTGTRNADVDRWRTVPTDSDGRYTLCWLPTGRELRVRVDSRDVDRNDVRVELSDSPILRRDF